MVGSPAVPVLGDLILKGFVNNAEEAFQAMKSSQLISERSLGLLREYGYIPYDLEPSNETVAKGLEYCLADDAVARVAKQLGHTDDYQYFNQRAHSYRKYFDRQSLFMRAVDSKGNFRPEFDPIRVIHRADDYTEGNAWQYIWLVPHDPHGLISLFPSEQRFVEKLDSLFLVEGDLGEEASPDISGLIGQYAHGNEPSHHIIYLYNYAGRPAKAAPLLRRVMKEMYHDDFDGLSGNEDVGQMSAWYILSAMGLYQVEPSGGKFVIGSPVLDEAIMHVGEGRTFTIRALNNSAKNIYVQSARLNGKKLNKSYLCFDDIHRGGTLELQMGPEPSRFGTKVKERP
jgi:predicted alpha-1,2-mannosidase